MKLILVIVCLFVAIHGQSISLNDVHEWFQFKTQYEKSYSSPDEEQNRLKVFLQKKQEISSHNARYEKGEVTYMKGINKFSDMTFEEFNVMYNGVRTKLEETKTQNDDSIPEDFTVPDSVDWREKGTVSEIKQQGECKSSWTFSAIGAVEGQHAKATGNLVSLSEQQLLDCASFIYFNFGCILESNYLSAYQYIIDYTGVASELSYPYVGEQKVCKSRLEDRVANISSYIYFPNTTEDTLTTYVAYIGPISLTIQTTENFLDYKGGVFYDETCTGNQTDLNHELLVVGYGTDNVTGADYYIMKNSWGISFGEDGYIRMSRNRNANCGITSNPAYPVI